MRIRGKWDFWESLLGYYGEERFLGNVQKMYIELRKK